MTTSAHRARRGVLRCVSSLVAYALLTTASLSDESVSGDAVPNALTTVLVGVREDARPFSYRKPTSASETVLPGFGGFTVEVCRHVLKQMTLMSEYRHLTFTAHVTNARERFKELDEEGSLFMLCGPDSITSRRLEDYRASHFVFESGMTYAYVNPRSPHFPRGDHCDHVVGVVRGTTADLDGLRDIASRDLLMRFDEALDLELSKTSEKLRLAKNALEDLIEEEIERAGEDRREKDLDALTRILTESDPHRLDVAIDNLADEKLSGRLNALMGERWAAINGRIARSIVTDECPQGLTSLPVRKYSNHDDGIARFCEGEVLYYLGDYDIIRTKIEEFSNCDVVVNRFTRSKEVYGVFFSKAEYYAPGANGGAASPEGAVAGRLPERTSSDGVRAEPIDVARFYATFNNLLLRSMQGRESAVEQIFSHEFAGEKKSGELDAFFDSFKISSFEE